MFRDRVDDDFIDYIIAALSGLVNRTYRLRASRIIRADGGTGVKVAGV